jgi:hypothetical protein
MIKRQRLAGAGVLSIAEKHYVTGAAYDDPLPKNCNKWEWFFLFNGGSKKLAPERRKYLNGLREKKI